MNSLTKRLLPVFAILIASGANESALAETPQLTANGWHTWRVTAAENAADWCCFQWNSGVSQQKSCDLDNRQNGYSRSDDQVVPVDEMQIYALTGGGELKKIRALSSQCRVTAKSEIIDLGFLETDDSVDWLQQYIDPPTQISTNVMAAISTHHGEYPITVLMDVVRSNSNMENRKDALFWLAMSESDQAYEFLDRMLSKN